MTQAQFHPTPQVHRYTPDWPAAVYSGLIAGAVFMVLEMIMVPLFMGESAWAPPRMIAAIVMGEGVLKPPTFHLGIFTVAMIVHFSLSIIYAVIFDWVTERLGLTATILLGAVFGLLLYLINFYGFTAIFPWFAMARNWVSILVHIVFGVSVAVAYKQIEQYRARPAVA